MRSSQALLPALYILTGLLLALLAWGIWQTHHAESGDISMSKPDEMLLWASILAAFSMGVFLLYVLMGAS